MDVGMLIDNYQNDSEAEVLRFMKKSSVFKQIIGIRDVAQSIVCFYCNNHQYGQENWLFRL